MNPQRPPAIEKVRQLVLGEYVGDEGCEGRQIAGDHRKVTKTQRPAGFQHFSANEPRCGAQLIAMRLAFNDAHVCRRRLRRGLADADGRGQSGLQPGEILGLRETRREPWLEKERRA